MDEIQLPVSDHQAMSGPVTPKPAWQGFLSESEGNQTDHMEEGSLHEVYQQLENMRIRYTSTGNTEKPSWREFASDPGFNVSSVNVTSPRRYSYDDMQGKNRQEWDKLSSSSHVVDNTREKSPTSLPMRPEKSRTQDVSQVDNDDNDELGGSQWMTLDVIESPLSDYHSGMSNGMVSGTGLWGGDGTGDGVASGGDRVVNNHYYGSLGVGGNGSNIGVVGGYGRMDSDGVADGGDGVAGDGVVDGSRLASGRGNNASVHSGSDSSLGNSGGAGSGGNGVGGNSSRWASHSGNGNNASMDHGNGVRLGNTDGYGDTHGAGNNGSLVTGNADTGALVSRGGTIISGDSSRYGNGGHAGNGGDANSVGSNRSRVGSTDGLVSLGISSGGNGVGSVGDSDGLAGHGSGISGSRPGNGGHAGNGGNANGVGSNGSKGNEVGNRVVTDGLVAHSSGVGNGMGGIFGDAILPTAPLPTDMASERQTSTNLPVRPLTIGNNESIGTTLVFRPLSPFDPDLYPSRTTSSTPVAPSSLPPISPHTAVDDDDDNVEDRGEDMSARERLQPLGRDGLEVKQGPPWGMTLPMFQPGSRNASISSNDSSSSSSNANFIRLQPMTPKSPDGILKAYDITSKAVDIAPKAYDITSKARDIAPKAVDVVPKAYDIAPKAVDVVPKAYDIAPKAADIAPKTYGIAPNAYDIRPKAADIASSATDACVISNATSDTQLSQKYSLTSLEPKEPLPVAKVTAHDTWITAKTPLNRFHDSHTLAMNTDTESPVSRILGPTFKATQKMLQDLQKRPLGLYQDEKPILDREGSLGEASEKESGQELSEKEGARSYGRISRENSSTGVVETKASGEEFGFSKWRRSGDMTASNHALGSAVDVHHVDDNAHNEQILHENSSSGVVATTKASAEEFAPDGFSKWRRSGDTTVTDRTHSNFADVHHVNDHAHNGDYLPLESGGLYGVSEDLKTNEGVTSYSTSQDYKTREGVTDITSSPHQAASSVIRVGTLVNLDSNQRDAPVILSMQEDVSVKSYQKQDVATKSYPTEDIATKSYPREDVGVKSYAREDVGVKSYPREDVGVKQYSKEESPVKSYSKESDGPMKANIEGDTHVSLSWDNVLDVRPVSENEASDFDRMVSQSISLSNAVATSFREELNRTMDLLGDESADEGTLTDHEEEEGGALDSGLSETTTNEEIYLPKNLAPLGGQRGPSGIYDVRTSCGPGSTNRRRYALGKTGQKAVIPTPTAVSGVYVSEGTTELSSTEPEDKNSKEVLRPDGRSTPKSDEGVMVNGGGVLVRHISSAGTTVTTGTDVVQPSPAVGSTWSAQTPVMSQLGSKTKPLVVSGEARKEKHHSRKHESSHGRKRVSRHKDPSMRGKARSYIQSSGTTTSSDSSSSRDRHVKPHVADIILENFRREEREQKKRQRKMEELKRTPPSTDINELWERFQYILGKNSHKSLRKHHSSFTPTSLRSTPLSETSGSTTVGYSVERSKNSESALTRADNRTPDQVTTDSDDEFEKFVRRMHDVRTSSSASTSSHRSGHGRRRREHEHTPSRDVLHRKSPRHVIRDTSSERQSSTTATSMNERASDVETPLSIPMWVGMRRRKKDVGMGCSACTCGGGGARTEKAMNPKTAATTVRDVGVNCPTPPVHHDNNIRPPLKNDHHHFRPPVAADQPRSHLNGEVNLNYPVSSVQYTNHHGHPVKNNHHHLRPHMVTDHTRSHLNADLNNFVNFVRVPKETHEKAASNTAPSSLLKLSLQDAFLYSNQDFVRRSRERVERIKERRKTGDSRGREAPPGIVIPTGKTRKPPEKEILNSVVAKPLKLYNPLIEKKPRPMTQKAIRNVNKRIYSKLPEVKRRKEEERKASLYQTNRLRAHLYAKHVRNLNRMYTAP